MDSAPLANLFARSFFTGIIRVPRMQSQERRHLGTGSWDVRTWCENPFGGRFRFRFRVYLQRDSLKIINTSYCTHSNRVWVTKNTRLLDKHVLYVLHLLIHRITFDLLRSYLKIRTRYTKWLNISIVYYFSNAFLHPNLHDTTIVNSIRRILLFTLYINRIKIKRKVNSGRLDNGLCEFAIRL